MVFNPSAGADEALGPFSFFQNNQYSVQFPADFPLQITFLKQMSPFFSESLKFSPTAHFLQDFYLRSRSPQGHDLYIHDST